MTYTWQAQALTAAGASAVSVIAIYGSCEALKMARKACFPSLDEWRMSVQRFANDDVLVMPVSDTIVWLCPHGGVFNRNKILSNLQQSGGQLLPSQESPLWPEAQSPFEADILTQLAAQKSPEMLVWLTAQLEVWRKWWHAPETAILPRPHQWLDVPTIAWVGCANAGKSSLLNALCGQSHVMVSEQAGTTRDWVSHQVTLPWQRGWSIFLMDTPGVRDGAPEVEQQALRHAFQALASVDLCIAVRAPGQPWPDTLMAIDGYIETHADETGKVGGAGTKEVPFCTSSTTFEGRQALVDWLANRAGAAPLDFNKPAICTSFLENWTRSGQDMSELSGYLGI